MSIETHIRSDFPSRHVKVSQEALTVAMPVRLDGVIGLRNTFRNVRESQGGIERNPDLPFGKLTRVHFARLVVVEQSLDADEQLRKLRRPILVFSSNYDGDLRGHLTELAMLGTNWLHGVLGHCEGYLRAAPDVDAIVDFLLAHRIPYAALHVGALGFSVAQIRDEAMLRDEIERFLDATPRDELPSDPLEIWEAVARHLQGGPFEWALSPAPNRGFWKTLPGGSVSRALQVARVVPLVLLVLFIVVGVVGVWLQESMWIATGAASAVILGVLVVCLRWLEETDPIFSRTRYDLRAQALAAREDKVIQNQMTILADMKPGVFRAYVLRTVLAAINTLGRLKYRNGRLGGIATIHFARWVILEEERAVLFLSNYTGSWEQYLGDFVDRASIGLNAVWSNVVRYPRTRWLILDGATDEQRFKAWVRAQQLETDLWYSAYRDLSMANILNNNEIRVGLGSRPTREQTAQWVRRL